MRFLRTTLSLCAAFAAIALIANLAPVARGQVSSPGAPVYSGAMMRNASDVTGVNYTTSPVVTWDTSEYDDGGWVDLANDRFVVPSGVTRVDVFAHLRIANFTASSVFVLFTAKGGVVTFPGATASISTGLATVDVTVAAIGVPVAAGDAITLIGFSSGDTSADLIATRSSFSIRKAK